MALRVLTPSSLSFVVCEDRPQMNGAPLPAGLHFVADPATGVVRLIVVGASASAVLSMPERMTAEVADVLAAFAKSTRKGAPPRVKSCNIPAWEEDSVLPTADTAAPPPGEVH